MLDPQVRTELRSLSKETSDLVARHLVVAGRLVDDDPDAALLHARAARALAGRVGVVREAAGVTAYLAGQWLDAVSELRAARRITGRSDHLPILADCERALGRPEKALTYGEDPAVPGLDQAVRVELTIVLAGARRDMGQADAAVLVLQEPARRTGSTRPWAGRLWYAYADALLAAGRNGDARAWFARTAELEGSGDTDAVDRLLELDGVTLAEQEGPEAGDPVPAAAQVPVAQVPAAQDPAAEDPAACEPVTELASSELSDPLQVPAAAAVPPAAAPGLHPSPAAISDESPVEAVDVLPVPQVPFKMASDELRLFD